MERLSNEELDALLRRIAEGQRNALCEFYLGTGKLLLAISRIYLKEQDIADAVHDFILKIGDKAEHYRTNDNPYGWLIKTYVNFVLNIRKKSKKHSHESLSEEIACAEYGLDKADSRADAYRILQKQKNKDKMLLILKFWGNQSFGQIATIMNKSKSTVQSRFETLIEKIRKTEMKNRTNADV